MDPTVSIITSSYNCSEYLRRCLDSVLQQTFGEWEHLVAECGSTDDSMAVLSSMAHPKLRIFQCGKISKAAARNLLIQNARGEYIGVLDADDSCVPQRLEAQVRAMESDKALIAVGSWMTRWYVQSGLRKRVRLPIRAMELEFLYRSGVSIIPHSTLLARTNAIRSIDGYDERMGEIEDYDFSFRLLKLGRICIVPDYLVDYCMRTAEAAPNVVIPNSNLIRRYLAYILILQSGFKPKSEPPPFSATSPVPRFLLSEARGLIRRACLRGIFSPRFDIGLRCRLLLGVRLSQILRNEI